ncbi:MAG: hypothetical protein HRT71_01510 [Flavobacteriales bacterium]|nr:hypothetical protein [Flavobacteriales bacterium]
MFEQIGGIIGDLIPMGIFIYASRLLSGKNRFKDDKSQRMLDEYKKKKYPYVIVYGGIVSFALLAIIHLSK